MSVTTVDRHITGDTLFPLSLKCENNLENYLVLFVNINDGHCLYDALLKITSEDRLREFHDVESSLSYIHNLRYYTNIFLIISGTSGQECVFQFAQEVQVTTIYVYCMDVDRHRTWGEKTKKIRCVVSDPTNLLTRLHADIKEFSGRWPLCEQSFRQALTAKSEWYHLFLLAICHRPKHIQSSYKEMFAECRAYYENNPGVIRHIDKFAQTYKAENAILEYTRDSFLYRIVNHALRTQDIATIRKFSPFIYDMYSQVSEHYRKFRLAKDGSIRALYRGQYLSTEELAYLVSVVKSRNPIIKLMTFCSMSLDPNVALNFALPIANRIPCLFEIIITHEYYDQEGFTTFGTQAFADISSISVMPEEQEVVFAPMANFRVKYVGDPSIHSDRPWVPIVLEPVLRTTRDFNNHYFNIINCIETETNPTYYTAILDMLQDNITDESNFKQTNWQMWWNNLIEQWGTDKIRQDPILLTFYDCFTDNNYWLRKAITLRKEIYRTEFQRNLSNFSSFAILFKLYKRSQHIPTRCIALYEDYIKPLCTIHSREVIECVYLTGQKYQAIGEWNYALECYEKCLSLDIENEYLFKKRIEEHLKNVRKCLEKPRQTKKRPNATVPKTIVKENLNNYEVHEEQWPIQWTLQHNGSTRIPIDKRLVSLEMYLMKRKDWLYAADIMIVLCIPYQQARYLPKNINQYFALAMTRKEFNDDHKANAINNRALCLWRYEKYVREWMLFHGLEKFLRPFENKSRLLQISILPRLVKLLAQLSLLITVCAAYVRNGQGNLGMDYVRFININSLKIQQLIFFDLNDPNLRSELEEYKETINDDSYDGTDWSHTVASWDNYGRRQSIDD
ncbi:unnamed protein product [Adineta ricciae]|nr:unnamed protein product [Adineta ricciae]